MSNDLFFVVYDMVALTNVSHTFQHSQTGVFLYYVLIDWKMSSSCTPDTDFYVIFYSYKFILYIITLSIYEHIMNAL